MKNKKVIIIISIVVIAILICLFVYSNTGLKGLEKQVDNIILPENVDKIALKSKIGDSGGNGDYLTRRVVLVVKTEKSLSELKQEFENMNLKFPNYFKNNNELMLAKEYSQIFKTVIDLFDKMVELLGDETMDLRELIEILDAGFAEIKIGIIPPGLDMVTIGDIERTRLDDIKVLFFVGVNEGIIPSSDNGGGIISQSEREVLTEKIQIAPTIREKSFIQRFYLYLNMTKPCERLYLSYSKIDNEGKSLKSSYLISSIKKMYPVIEVVDEEENISLLDNIYSVGIDI